MEFLVILLSPWSPRCPRHPHVIPVMSQIVPVSSPLSPHHLHSPQKVAMWSPWLWSPWSLWSPPHVVPVVPTFSPSSLHLCCHPHIIPTSSRRSPHHPQAPRYPLQPTPYPWGVGAPNQ